MAFAFVAHRGSANSKSASTQISMSPTAGIAVDAVLVIRVASDSDDRASPLHTSVTDSKGNTYTKVAERVAGGIDDHVAASLWIAKITVALTTGDTITATLAISKTARAIAAEELSGGVPSVVGSNTSAGTGTAPSVTLSGLSAGVTYFWIGHVGIEGPNGDGFTQDADYANNTSIGTTGGSATSNVASRMGTRSAALTSDTYNPTLGTSRDWVAILAAIQELTPVSQTAQVPYEARAIPSLNIRCGDFFTPTTVGTQDITDVGFQPLAVILLGGLSTADDSENSGAGMGIGFADGAVQRAAIWDNTGGAYVNKALACKGGSSFSYAADWSAWLSNGFRLNYTDIGPAIARKAMYLALGGDHVSAVKVGEFTLNASTGQQDVTGIGFQPDLVILIHAVRDALDTSGSFPNSASTGGPIGIGAARSSTQQWAYFGRNATRWQRTNRCILGVDGVLENHEFEVSFVAPLTDGFRLNIDVAPTSGTAHKVAYLAIKGPQIRVDSFDLITSGGPTQDITAPGFQPRGTLLLSFDRAATTARSSGLELIAGFQSEPIERERCYWWGWDSTWGFGQRFRATQAWHAWAKGNPSTLESAADISAFLSTGFRLNWVQLDTVAKQALYISFGDAATGTQVSQTADAAIEALVGLKPAAIMPKEAKGIVGAALQPLFEAQAGIAQARAPNIEAVATARTDSTTVLESLFGLRPAAAVVHEARGAVQASAAVPKESLAALRREQFAVWEALADSRHSVASGLEALGGLLAAGTAQQEAQGYVTGHRVAIFEALVGARTQDLNPWESLAGLSNGASASLEALRSFTAATSPPIEATDFVASLRSALHEALADARAMNGPAWETLVGVRAQTQIPIEALIGLQVQAGPLLEALLLLLSERAVPFEAGQGATGAVSNALMVPYEASGIVASQGVAPVEALVLVFADRAPAMEILQRVRAGGIAQLEWLRGTRMAIAVPVEAGGTAVPPTVLIARFALPRRRIGGLPGYPPGRLPGRDL